MSEIRNVKCENKVNPLNVNVTCPRFSWQIISEEKNLFQKSYRIVVTKGNELKWDSGVVESRQTFGIPYAGETCWRLRQMLLFVNCVNWMQWKYL